MIKIILLDFGDFTTAKTMFGLSGITPGISVILTACLSLLIQGANGDRPPSMLVSPPNSIIQVDETAKVGQPVFQFQVESRSRNAPSAVYALSSREADTVDYFSINNATGWLSVRKPLDLKKHPKFLISVTATLPDGSLVSGREVLVMVRRISDPSPLEALGTSFPGMFIPGEPPNSTAPDPAFRAPLPVPVEAPTTTRLPTQWSFATIKPNTPAPNPAILPPPKNTWPERNRITTGFEHENDVDQQREWDEQRRIDLERQRKADSPAQTDLRHLGFIALIIPIGFLVWLRRRWRRRNSHVKEKLAIFKSVSGEASHAGQTVCKTESMTVAQEEPAMMLKKSLLAPTWSNSRYPTRSKSGTSISTLQSGSDGYLQPDVPVQVWEVSRERIRTLDLLGEGCFGQVFKAEASEPSGEVLVVAVKTLKNNAVDKEKRDLLNELELMKTMEQHPNVVQLLGCCTKNDPIYVIMEYVALGKLLSVLRRSRNSHYYGHLTGDDAAALTSQDLTSFGFQVARGMEYLSAKGILHRDLAARNILVDQDLVCKVSDFGLARDIIDDHIYERKSEGRLPIRWMAPESLFDNIFSTKSDVWSFGILLWEIATLGSTPYPGIKGWKQVMDRIRTGERLLQPPHCKREFYNIMHYCWEADPEQRISFADLVTELGKLLGADQDYLDLNNFPDNTYENAIMTSETDEKV